MLVLHRDPQNSPRDHRSGIGHQYYSTCLRAARLSDTETGGGGGEGRERPGGDVLSNHTDADEALSPPNPCDTWRLRMSEVSFVFVCQVILSLYRAAHNCAEEWQAGLFTCALPDMNGWGFSDGGF